jgi:hypothetical protein
MTAFPPLTGRRVIQIAAIPESENHSYRVFALCDDGTIWEAFYFFGDKGKTTPPRWGDWERIPGIPPLA